LKLIPQCWSPSKKKSPPTTSPGTANRPFLSICSRNGPVTAS
jgi:hypothetical protein